MDTQKNNIGKIFNKLKNSWFVLLIIWLLLPDMMNAQFNDTVYIEMLKFPVINHKKDVSELSDTMTLRFNLVKNWGTEYARKGFYLNESDSIDVKATEYVNNEKDILPITYIPGSLKKLSSDTSGNSIPSDITISLLVDYSGSISDAEFKRINEAIRSFVEKVPEGCLYYSWFSSDISESKLLTKDIFEEVTRRASKGHTALYNAIYTKLLEFDSTAQVPNMEKELQYKRNMDIARKNSKNNYLIVLTDGVNDVDKIGKYLDGDWENINSSKLLKALQKYSNKVKVFALGFGENSDNFDEDDLKRICEASGNPGGYFLVKPESILQYFKVDLADKFSEYYEIKLQNQPGKTYQGNRRRLEILIKSNNPEVPVAKGSVEYSLGAPTNQFIVGKQSIWRTITTGIFVGLILFLVVVIIMQLIIPLMKNKIFNIRYAKKYKPAKNELLIECPYCGDPLNPGDIVIAKCEHIVHKVCWNDFGHVCPEYGQNCNKGKQDYFDITDPFSKKNRKYYVKWVLFGMIGGFLSWFPYLLLKDWGFLFDFARKITETFRPDLANMNSLNLFSAKISSLILIGSTMGFFLTFFFTFIEDYRRKSMKVVGSILLRSLVGAVLGFLSFLIGGIILVWLNQPYTSFASDWIPWILFGASIGLTLSVKTTIVWKHGLMGGIISIVFCFFILYLMAGDIDYSALLISFMLFGGGLGISIATVHSRAENYYLKITQGKKNEETIPIHKWMSYQGGHNEVYIGRAFSCEIQMNWESKNPDIAEKHAKLYLNSNNIPVIVSLVSDMTTVYNDRFEMNTSKEYELYNGIIFKIGNTVFQYFEKEK